MEIHQKKAGPEYHRLKTIVKRSIEQNLRVNNFEARYGNFETSAMVKNPRMNSVNKEVWEIVGSGKLTEQCSKGDNCSFRHSRILIQDLLRSVKNALRTRSLWGRSPTEKMAQLPCKDYLKGTCTTPFCEKWLPPECLFYKSEKGCRFGEKCSYAHRQVDEQPSKRSEKNGDKSAVAILKITRQLGCVFQDMEPPKSSSILWKSSNVLKPIRCVRFTKAVVGHANMHTLLFSLFVLGGLILHIISKYFTLFARSISFSSSNSFETISLLVPSFPFRQR